MHLLSRLSVFSPARTFSRFNMQDVRVRFAPSPTGNLHLGGLRTAMYNYLFAKKNGGKFVLRIEDTDQKRVKPESLKNISEMLTWVSLVPDESPFHGGPYGSYLQSENLQRYEETANILVETGAAYRCFCSETRLTLMRKEAMRNRQNPGYDNKCRHLAPSEVEANLKSGLPHTIRFKIECKPIAFNDIVYGLQTIDISGHEADFIIIKSDGFPTYHFACVVDDHFMAISHILRGTEWLSSTTKHLMLYKSFGWEPPIFAHLPLLVNSDGSKLSKRQEALGIEYFKNHGYEPLALLNFLSGIGSGFGFNSGCKVISLEELARKFILSEVNTNSCIVDMQKLEVYNHDYLTQQLSHQISTTSLVDKFRALLQLELGEKYDNYAKNLTDDYIQKIFMLYRDRISKLSDLIHSEMQFLWTLPDICVIKDTLEQQKIDTNDAVEGIKISLEVLSNIPPTVFDRTNISDRLKTSAKNVKLKYVDYMKMLRVVMTGLRDGPGVAEICTLLDQEKCIARLKIIAENLDHLENVKRK